MPKLHTDEGGHVHNSLF